MVRNNARLRTGKTGAQCLHYVIRAAKYRKLMCFNLLVGNKLRLLAPAFLHQALQAGAGMCIPVPIRPEVRVEGGPDAHPPALIVPPDRKSLESEQSPKRAGKSNVSFR